MHNIDQLPTMRDFLLADPPEMLYHYTTSAALISIVRSRHFWAGRPEQMNDGMELSHAFSCLLRVVAEEGFGETGVDAMFPRVISRDIMTGTAELGASAFITSLSKADDSLSQWRAYCASGGGVCLGLPGAELLKPAAVVQEWTLAPCIYDEGDQLKVVRELYELHLRELKAVLGTHQLDASAAEAQIILADRARKLFTDLHSYGLFLKHPSFHAEEEWRLVKFLTDQPDPADLQFLPGPDGVRVFLPFRILADNHPGFSDHPRPSVRTGPTRLPGTAEYATSLLLENWNGPGNAPVLRTRSTYR